MMIHLPQPSGLLESQLVEISDRLRARERDALVALGQARAQGLPGGAARHELHEVRDELDAHFAMWRALETP